MLPSQLLQKGWCQKSYARKKNGERCMIYRYVEQNSDQFDYFCMLGSIAASGFNNFTQSKLSRRIDDIVREREFDDGRAGLAAHWQDDLPFNEESKQRVIEIVRDAEIELGLDYVT